jgi:uncharacterized OB-fold protein
MAVEAHANSPVVESEGGARLVGSRCDSCGNTTFPSQPNCSRCGGTMSAVELPTHGTVWSWTVQRIAVKPPYTGPQPFEPFVVGYVDLGSLKVESPMFGRDLGAWHIGEPVQLCTGPAHSHLKFWFEPKEPGE